MGRTDRQGDNVTTDPEFLALGEGRLFRVYDKQNIPAVGVTGILEYGMITGDKEIHIRPLDVSCSADKLDINFYEDSSYTGGTQLVVHRYNRNIEKSVAVTFFRAPTVATDGLEFSLGYIPGSTGIGGTRSGGNVSGSLKYALKPNTKYLWRFTNGSSSINTVFWSFSLEEV